MPFLEVARDDPHLVWGRRADGRFDDVRGRARVLAVRAADVHERVSAVVGRDPLVQERTRRRHLEAHRVHGHASAAGQVDGRREGSHRSCRGRETEGRAAEEQEPGTLAPEREPWPPDRQTRASRHARQAIRRRQPLKAQRVDNFPRQAQTSRPRRRAHATRSTLGAGATQRLGLVGASARRGRARSGRDRAPLRTRPQPLRTRPRPDVRSGRDPSLSSARD
mmetsp:Transcript_7928/g.23481  ORF Transcript_7928/g.23481 Transcript_7928/m.23481 type:complete len:222 (+) Transcript_7928:601-1266(+)